MTNKELREAIEKHIQNLQKLMEANKDNHIKDGDIDAAMNIAYRNELERAQITIEKN